VSAATATPKPKTPAEFRDHYRAQLDLASKNLVAAQRRVLHLEGALAAVNELLAAEAPAA
jgi:hypothetical protein